MTSKTEPFDPAEYLTTPEAWIYLINDALATGDAGYIADAINIVARAIGMAEAATRSGATHEARNKTSHGALDPNLTTLLGVTRALGLTLSVQPTARDQPQAMIGA